VSRIQAFAPQHVNLPVGNLAATGQMFQGMTGDPRQDIGRLGDAYNAAYQGILGFNTGLLTEQQRLTEQGQNQAAAGNVPISDLMAGRVTAAGDLRSQAAVQNADINRRYGQLSADVLGGIRGIEASRLQDINTQYARDASDATQSLASRGLGNTTVQESVSRGLQSDRDRARTRLANEIAGLTAGYQSQLGLAGLSDLRRGQEQGVSLGQYGIGLMGDQANDLVRQQEQQVGFGREFRNYLAGVQAPYPDASMFAALAQQAGAAQQAQADRSQLMGVLGGMGAVAGQAGGAGVTAAVPTTGGGFMGSTGRGMSGPEGNYGATVGPMLLPSGGGFGTPAMAPPVSVGAVYGPALQGAGGGMTGGAYLAPGVPLEASDAAAYAPALATGGGFGSTGDASAGVSGGGGSYSPYGGFGGGTGGGAYGGYGGYGGSDDSSYYYDDGTLNEFAEASW
jgi:hypothetical protein